MGDLTSKERNPISYSANDEYSGQNTEKREEINTAGESDEEIPYKFWLASLWQIGNQKKRQASVLCGEKALYRMPHREMEALGLFSKEELALLEKSRASFHAEEEWDSFQTTYQKTKRNAPDGAGSPEKDAMRFFSWDDPAYPERLRTIHDAPYALFVKGDLPSEHRRSIAVVGARGCSEYGRSVSRMIGKTMAEHDVQVISGMALGVDSASHAGALEADGDTYAVLGGGADVCYPRTSVNIYNNILDGHGGILSEYFPGTQPQPFFFPQRNRIISGLADLLIVVEAREKSGSLITADFALEQGKDVYAVPGRYLDPLSAGCNRLIEQGAGIFVDMDSFLKNTGITAADRKKKKRTERVPLSAEAERVYDCLDLSVKQIDDILDETGLDLLTVLDALSSLKQANLAQETFQNYFCRKIRS